MDLKCIGGSCDGQMQLVERYNLVVGNSVRVSRFVLLSTVIEAYEKYTLPDIVRSPYEFYVVDKLSCVNSVNEEQPINEIWFLRPQNLTMFDAVQLQFRK